MKCPKCGYTSFESYDTCHKCSTDLIGFKASHGIKPLVLPASIRATMAADLASGQADDDATTENDNDMFSFNLQPQQADDAAPAANPFNFDNSSADVVAPSAAKQEDPFASLLGSTPQQPAAAAAPAQSFELNSFSWDETPAAGQADSTGSGEKSTDDDFNSLFGDIGGGDKK